MSTTIKYQNEHFQFITNQQASNLADYSKLYYEGNNIKKEEIYRDNNLWGGVYYLSDTENAIDILNELGPHLMWSFCIGIQNINGYRVEEYRSYDENMQIKPTHTKIVIDNQERDVAVIEYDIQTNQAITGFKSFHFGGQQIPDDDPGMLWDEDAEGTFRFGDDGQLRHIGFNIGYIDNRESWKNLQHFQNDAGFFIDDMMPPEVFNYFTNLEPLVPPF